LELVKIQNPDFFSLASTLDIMDEFISYLSQLCSFVLVK
jgi:hypothetical protein